jgi:hypothetical protein
LASDSCAGGTTPGGDAPHPAPADATEANPCELNGFDDWLTDRLGPGHGRRAVHVRSDRVLVSKVEPGLPLRVLEAVERLPDLFEPEQLRSRMPAGCAPVEAWHRASRAVIERAVEAGALTGPERAEVLAGLDSVAALLDACLWTATGQPGWQPSAAELSALTELEQRLASGSVSLFTRYYGDFEGRRVENHCPGAAIARRLLAAARDAVLGSSGAPA